MAAKKSATKKKPKKTELRSLKDLGEVPGIREQRKRTAKGGGGGDTFMHEQREQDAEEAKLGAAAKDVKQCHLLAQEAALRLSAARKSTSTRPAIKHDLERVVELAGDIGDTAKDALEALGR